MSTDGAWVEMTPEEMHAFMLANLHELALQENRMTQDERIDEWLRVEYFDAYFAAGCPKGYGHFVK